MSFPGTNINDDEIGVSAQGSDRYTEGSRARYFLLNCSTQHGRVKGREGER